MTDPRDDVDTWLHAEVEPMRPPPGTFERIRKQARRRKRRRALVSAASAGAAAAVIVAAVVALPRVVPSVLHLKTNPAADRTAAGGTLRTRPPASTAPRPSADATKQHRLVSPPAPVPANFAATSVTFVNLNTGWVIGQAGIPGRCYDKNPDICTSVARTDNAGESWFGVPAPVTGAPDGGTGVSQIRFLDSQDGWAFGPELWATHDGGQRWAQVPTGGLRVLSLETTGSEAFAVLARCAGTGADYGAGCTRFFLWSSPVSSDAWAQVAGTAGASPLAAAATGSSALVLAGTSGYWYEPNGALLSGPVTGGAPWTPVGGSALPCLPGPAAADGRPALGQLAGSAPGDLALACPASGQPGSSADQRETIYGSTDGGQSWQVSGTLTTAGPATSLAATTGGVLVLGTGQCIDVSSDGGAKWRQAQLGPAGGFSYVGMTSPVQGVAVPADSSQHAVWFTVDAGRDWASSPVRGS